MTSPNGGATSNGADATVGTVHQPRPLGSVKAPRPTKKNLGYGTGQLKRKGK